MTDWSNQVFQILTAKTGSLKEFADLAGEDWRFFYTAQSLAGCDLRGQDLRGMDLTNCNISSAILDKKTLISKEFDHRLDNYSRYVKIRIPIIINNVILEYSKAVGYLYKAWAYKNLIDRFRIHSKYGQLSHIKKKLFSNKKLYHIVFNSNQYKSKKLTILLNKEQMYEIDKFSNDNPNIDAYSFAFLSSILGNNGHIPFLDENSQFDLFNFD